MIKEMMPEKIPAFAAAFYSMIPARMFIPHYEIIAQKVTTQCNGRIVDIGTGPGMLPIEIAKRSAAAKVIGIDVSEKMIAIANKNKEGQRDASSVEFKVMNANKLGFEDSSLDMVISTGSMHHWKDPVGILNEIYRCLKPGSEAWIYDGYGNATDTDIKKGIRKLFLGFPPAGLVKRILKIHGFSEQEYDKIKNDLAVKTKFQSCFLEKCGIMMRMRFKK